MVDFKVMLLSLAFIVALTQAKPFFIDCQSDSDCGVNACCAIGQQRFALPRCLALTGEGAPCRPGNAPFNTTLYYLSRDSVDFINVWHDLCPCSFGLVCSRDSGVCELPSFHVNNLLDEDQWEED